MRLARRLFTLCSAMSLVLFVAACVLWVRSYVTSAAGASRSDYAAWDTLSWTFSNIDDMDSLPPIHFGESRIVMANGGLQVYWTRTELKHAAGAMLPPGFEARGVYPLLSPIPGHSG